MLSRIKLNLEEIRRALLDVDDSKLTLDDLRVISRQLPTPEEVGSAHPFCNILDEDSLDHQDQGLRGRRETGQIRSIFRSGRWCPYTWSLEVISSATQISTIPRLSQRLECMLYRRKLELEVEEIRPDMQTVRDACKDLRGSERFKTILQVRYAPLWRISAYSVKRLSLP